jgi:hypothetical protein
MAKNYIWKLWLYPNLLTKDVPNDYVAEVSTAGTTKHNEDIAKAIKDEGSDLQLETLVDVLNRGDRWRRHFLLEGSSVQDSNVRLAPRVKGNWEGAKHVFDPTEHKITIDATPTADLRKALADEVSAEVLDVKVDGGARIEMITDVATGKTDGTITRDGDLIIEGEKIRIAPLGEEDLGIFFVGASGSKYPVAVPLTQNDPKKIVCRVPDLLSGTYTLKIVTRFSNGTQCLKAPRTILYDLPLTVTASQP